jgi:hypothetical protein
MAGVRGAFCWNLISMPSEILATSRVGVSRFWWHVRMGCFNVIPIAMLGNIVTLGRCRSLAANDATFAIICTYSTVLHGY